MSKIPETPPLISVTSMSKSYQTTGGDVHILKNVNFDIPDGSFTVVYGPSGSGKSTLLNCLIGLDKPTSGKISYDGRDMYGMSPNELAYFRAHTSGIVQQSNHWVNSLNVIENVALPLHFLGYSKENANRGAREALDRLGMTAYATKYPTALSGGEQQRVAMARAIVNNPSYIVADEPTGNLDSANGDAVIKLLRYFNKELLRTVVLVTHNLEYLPVADKLLLIEDGTVTDMKDAAIRNVTSHLISDMQRRIEGWAHNT